MFIKQTFENCDIIFNKLLFLLDFYLVETKATEDVDTYNVAPCLSSSQGPYALVIWNFDGPHFSSDTV
jgi:hypothetical protein